MQVAGFDVNVARFAREAGGSYRGGHGGGDGGGGDGGCRRTRQCCRVRDDHLFRELLLLFLLLLLLLLLLLMRREAARAGGVGIGGLFQSCHSMWVSWLATSIPGVSYELLLSYVMVVLENHQRQKLSS